MLYEIDESCLESLEANKLEAIAFFEQLALDRRKCRNIVVAKREVFYRMAKVDGLSSLSKTIYKMLGNRMSERKVLLERTKKYCRIVDKSYKKTLPDDDHEIILLDVEDGANRDYTSCPLMVAENEEDIEFYKIIGKYFMLKMGLENLNINFETKNGGGSTIADVLKKIIDEKNQMCLCLVDSDRKYFDDSPGDTMNRVIEATKNTTQDFWEILPLEMHEIENIIPHCILVEVANKRNLDKQGILFLEYLLKCDSSLNSPVFFFDLKKGILKNAFVLETSADAEKKKIYRKKEKYRQYWEKYVKGYGVNIAMCNDDILIKGVCTKVLRYSLQYFNESNILAGLQSIVIENPIQQVWEKIGEKVYCWGCVGGRIAV